MTSITDRRDVIILQLTVDVDHQTSSTNISGRLPSSYQAVTSEYITKTRPCNSCKKRNFSAEKMLVSKVFVQTLYLVRTVFATGFLRVPIL